MKTSFRLYTALLAFLCSAQAWAEDATVTITQDALNAYAMAVGTIAYTQHARAGITLPEICWGSDMFGFRICRQTFLVLTEGTATWSIQAPRFEVTASGIRFKALFQGSYASSDGLSFGSTLRSVDIGAAVTYDTAAKLLRLTVAPDTVSIEAGGPFGSIPAAEVSPGSYYSTRLATPTENFSFSISGSTRTVTASIASMQIIYATKQVLLKPIFSIN